MKFRNTLLSATSSIAPMAMTPIERSVGRVMRAPDHDAGTGDAAADAAADASADADAAADKDVPAGSALGDAAVADAASDASAEADADADKAGDDDKADADKDKAADEDADTPAEYDVDAFKGLMPEGMEFDQEAFDLVAEDFQGAGLDQEGAGTVLKAFAEKVAPMIAKRTEDAFDEQGAEMRATMARDLMADPEVGGKALEENRSFAAKAIAHFVPDAKERAEFSTFLNESAMGDNRFLMRIIAGSGRALAEATPPGGGVGDEKTAEQIFYGKREQKG